MNEEDKLIEALLATKDEVGGSGAMTAVEIARKLQMSRERVLVLLHRIADEGRLEVVQVRRTSLSGVLHQAPAYRVRPDSR